MVIHESSNADVTGLAQEETEVESHAETQYIEFFYPGSFVSESNTQEVADRTPPAELPKGAFGYRFFARSEVIQDGETLRGQPNDRSPMTYFGEAMTLEEVKALPGNNSIIVSNMECNGWNRVVRTNRGQFFPIETGDSVVTRLPGLNEAPTNER